MESMKVKPIRKRAIRYYDEFIKLAIKNRSHLEVFLESLPKYTDAEKKFLLEYWDLDHQGGSVEVLSNGDHDDMVKEELQDMSKEELEEYALEEFNVDLDRRQSVSTLIEEIIELKTQV